MLEVIQHIYIIPLLTSTVLSFRVFKDRWPFNYQLFSALLLFITLTEATAIGWKYYYSAPGKTSWSPSNLWIYNLSIILQYVIYMAIYYQVIKSVRIKRSIIIMGVLFALLSCTNLLFVQTIHQVNSYTVVMASGITVFLTIAYFDQLRGEKEYAPILRNPMAWISLGAFIYHAANLPYMVGLNYLIRNKISLAIALYYVFLLLNCIMYSLYIIAFLCKIPLRKS